VPPLSLVPVPISKLFMLRRPLLKPEARNSDESGESVELTIAKNTLEPLTVTV
jgi:hypothetical protein